MHPTIQEIEDYKAAVYQFDQDTKAWCEAAVEALEKNEAIGGNPPSPPPPPPGTHH